MGFLGFLGTPLGYVMYAIFKLLNSYGWALILFVLLTKVCLFPLAIKQQKSMGKTASIQPKQKELERKYGKDKQKYQEELMKLYEQEGVSMTGGCLPMLIQMVLLFGIVDVIYRPLKHLLHIPADIIDKALAIVGQVSGAEIQVIQQVQAGTNTALNAVFSPDMLESLMNFNMNFMGFDLGVTPSFGFNWLILIPIISALTGLLTSIISTKQQERMGQKMQGAMKYMMYFSPLLSLWIGFSLPSGVGLYWIVSNIFQIAQSLILGKVYSPEKLATMTDKNADKNREKMRIKRERMEAYNKLMVEKGRAPAPTIEKKKPVEITEKQAKDARDKIAEARRKMAEKYGDDYKDD